LDPVLDHPNEDEDEQQQRENDMNGNAGQLFIDEEDQYEDGMEELIAEEICKFNEKDNMLIINI
jgi:hypothetical protein